MSGGAIVLGANYRALSVVRSLGRQGIETWVARTDEHRLAVTSRYSSRVVELRCDADETLDRLLALAEHEELVGWTLLPTHDDEAELLSTNHERLSRTFRLGAAPPAMIDWALDKRLTDALAAEHGVDRPRTWSMPRIDAIDSVPLTYPVIVKPAVRPRQFAVRTPKAWRADDRDQLEHAYRTAAALMPAELLMVQELIPSGSEQLSFAALCRDGAVLASVAARRIRQWPREFGNASTFVETIEDDGLSEPAERLLAATRFTGLIELEFMRDSRDGRLVLHDANPRPWGWIAISPPAGVDFTHLHWKMLNGETFARVRGRPGVRWVRLATDLAAAADARIHGELSTRQYLRDLRPPLACAVFASDDPAPALIDAPLLVAIGAARKLAAAGRRLRREPVLAPPSFHSERRRRALIIVENRPVPGDRRVWSEAVSLRRAGWDVTVLAPHASDEPLRPVDEDIEGVQIRRFALRPAEHTPLSYAGEYTTAMWRIWREIRKLARERPFDIVHACNPPDFLLLAALGQRRRGTRLVFDHHDLSPEMWAGRSEGSSSPIADRVLGAMERVAFAVADVALATNGSVAQVAVERGRMAPDDVFVVRNGPMLDRFTAVEPDPALRRGRDHLLVYVGLMGPQDGVDCALRALAELRRERVDWHALFLGDGEMLPSLRELSSELRLDEHVEFFGLASDLEVRRAICSSDVCLAPDPRNPYTDRSTLVKIAEYMALARPTVSFDLTESRVTAGDAALFATDNDPGQFASRISELLDDPELRRTLGSAGRARVEGKLAWEHSERTLLAAYERALEPKGPPIPEPAGTRDAAFTWGHR